VYHEQFDDQILGMQMLPTKQLLFWTRKKIVTATTNLVLCLLLNVFFRVLKVFSSKFCGEIQSEVDDFPPIKNRFLLILIDLEN